MHHSKSNNERLARGLKVCAVLIAFVPMYVCVHTSPFHIKLHYK